MSSWLQFSSVEDSQAESNFALKYISNERMRVQRCILLYYIESIKMIYLLSLFLLFLLIFTIIIIIIISTGSSSSSSSSSSSHVNSGRLFSLGGFLLGVSLWRGPFLCG